ncbi:DUF3093 domain-containing protein [Brevibacterium pityocampae]|uniref:DUF3093 domain-containing protein n=1 Tax=Brevibacterium pityocampae TaxID=506594 RepID=A0ABP8JFH4_9MICO
MSFSSGSDTVVHYSERLWPPVTWWVVTVLLSAMTSLMVYPVWELGAFIVPVVVLVLAALWLRSLSAPIVVSDAGFRAGPAHIERRFIAEATPFDERGSFAARGVHLDARAFLMTRPWVKTVVRVALDDPADPTPYWLVSTKHPHELAAALNRG